MSTGGGLESMALHKAVDDQYETLTAISATPYSRRIRIESQTWSGRGASDEDDDDDENSDTDTICCAKVLAAKAMGQTNDSEM